MAYSIFSTSYLTLKRSLDRSSSIIDKTMERLSTGLRINSASDDAAGLMFSKKLESRVSSLSAVNTGIAIGIGKLENYESNLESAHTMLSTIRDLAVTASSGTYSASELASYDQQAQDFLASIENNINTANAEFGADEIALSSGDFLEQVNSMSEEEAIDAGYDENHRIYTAEQLVNKVESDLSGDFMLMNDIDMSELGTLLDSAIDGVFQGTFDGNGYSINNLTIDTQGTSSSNIGLFESIDTATIEHLAIKNASITATNNSKVGILSGGATDSTINNLYTTGSVTASGLTGGITGESDSSIFSKVYSQVDISASSNRIGGIVGLANGGTLDYSYATGDISGDTSVGGLIGEANGIRVTSSYATGDVTGSTSVGGLVGYLQGIGIEESFSSGAVTGSTNVGGLVGYTEIVGVHNNTSFWNTETSGQATSAGDAVGLTTANIVSGASPIDTWNTSTWDTTGAIPTLKETLTARSFTTKSIEMQVGIDGTESSRFTLDDLGVGFENWSGIDLTSQENALAAIEEIDEALEYLSAKKSYAGAQISILGEISDNNYNKSINYQDNLSKIRDADIAAETAELTKQQILQDSILTMMAQVSEMEANSVYTLLSNNYQTNLDFSNYYGYKSY